MRTAKSRAHSDARTQETWATIDQRLKFLRPLKCKWFEKCHILGEKKISILILRATAWWFILETFRSCRKVTKAPVPITRWKHRLLGLGREIHWFLTSVFLCFRNWWGQLNFSILTFVWIMTPALSLKWKDKVTGSRFWKQPVPASCCSFLQMEVRRMHLQWLHFLFVLWTWLAAVFTH